MKCLEERNNYIDKFLKFKIISLGIKKRACALRISHRLFLFGKSYKLILSLC